MALDGAAQGVAPEDSVLGDAEWRYRIAGLATAVFAVLALFCIGALLPYLFNPPTIAEAANVPYGSLGPSPLDGWMRPVIGAVILAVLFAALFGPLLLLAATLLGAVWLSKLWRRPEPKRLSRSLTLVIIMTGSVATLMFWFSEPMSALTAWQRD